MANAQVITSGNFNVIERPMKASEAVKNRMLLDIDTNGEFVKHASSGDVAPVLVAMPDPDHASVNTYASATAFSDGDRIRAAAPTPGSTGYLWLADSQTITRNENLQSAGDGTVEVYAPQAVNEGGAATYTIFPKQIVARALEAKTTSGSVELIHVMFV